MPIRLVLAIVVTLAGCFFEPGPVSARTVRESVGVNIHFTEPKPGEMAMMAGAGVGWVRMDLDWGATERQRGVYDFSRYDMLLSNLDRNKMRAVFILDYGNDIYGASGKPPYDDAGRQAFANWAVAAVEHFRNRHVMWEMWNEPNSPFWPHHNAADYAKLAITVDSAIHTRFPKETLIGPATSGIDLSFLEACFQAGCLQYWDAVSVHPYRQTAPETVAPEFAKLRNLIARYAPAGKSIPIISGEWGYSTSWSGCDEDKQAKYAVRELLTNLRNGVDLSIWYDWHNDGVDPKNSEHNFGLVQNPYQPNETNVYSPKPAYTALQTMLSILGECAFDRSIPQDSPDVYALAFKPHRENLNDVVSKRDKTRYAVWCQRQYGGMATLPVPPGRYKVTDSLGQTSYLTADGPGLMVVVSDSPSYITRE